MKHLVFFTLCLMTFFGGSSAWAMGDAGFVQQALVGNKAQDFTLGTVRDQKLNLAKFIQGKKAMVLFWATWCPHCREALKEINEMRQKILSQNIALVFINVGESKGTVEGYLNNHRYDFDVALDEEQNVSNAYGVDGVPMMVYIDERGTVKSVGYGFDTGYAEQFK